ncbi:response regulator transcription factor [Paenibacillus thiaminolyticus]|uniref:response regulator transcription factor n=1 Tax=Paenibacillus thiaminolyticus TaxID=49283 RepID=UPI002350707B|nr:response regulator transcription factor [Paenibacillus thiaminolyticus]WCR28353.1 response regulator transcription factor [Paenibacillus thiaminolyticus]
MEQETILIVDDDRDIVEFIEVYLGREGYSTIKTHRGAEALELLLSHDIHLVILDIMMPDLDGIETCRRIRERHNIPIIMLSAKSTELDKVVGLNSGADDYMVKPFSPIELTARVKAQLRRYTYLNHKSATVSEEDVIQVKGLRIDMRSRVVTIFGRTVKLTKTEYDILLLLAKHTGRVFTMEEIYEKVWKEQYFEGNNTVMVHIARLREKIEDDPKESRIVKNIWGVGYKIES